MEPTNFILYIQGLMKSPFTKQIQSERSDKYTKFSKVRAHRFKTLADSPSTFYNNNPSQYLGETNKRILTKSVSMSHEAYKQYQNRNNCQSPTRRLPNKCQYELVNNMSNKSYGNIIAYGWVHMKVKAQPLDQSYFSINLGNIKNFLLVEIEGEPGAKSIAQEYQIQLTELAQKQFSVSKQTISRTIQKTVAQIFGKKQKISDIKNRLSIVSVVIKEDEIIVAGIGELSVLCFTKNEELINANEANYETLNENQKFMRYFKRVKNNDIKQKVVNRNKKYNLLSYKFSFNQFDQVDETQINRVKLRTLKSSSIVWMGIFSKNILRNCPKHYIKECINKQFCLASPSYQYNQIAKQSSNKIINSLATKELIKPMTSIIIFMSEYPIEKNMASDQRQWHENRKSSRLKTFESRGKQRKEIKHLQTNQGKLFKYVGNRSSFVKCTTPGNKIQVKNESFNKS